MAAAKKREPWVGETFSGKKCEGRHGPSGTHDYLHRGHPSLVGLLETVENAHFTEGVESLTEGATTEPMGDINWVLMTFPNHHRALYSAMQFRLRHKRWPQKSKGLPAECYYQRAIKFSPTDLTVYSQYAFLQNKFRKYEGAVKTYEAADRLFPGDALINYNMALNLVKLKRFKQARKIAEKVYPTGFPLQGLKNMLRRAGHWEDETSPETLEDKAAKLQASMEEDSSNETGPNTPPTPDQEMTDADNTIEKTTVSEASAD